MRLRRCVAGAVLLALASARLPPAAARAADPTVAMSAEQQRTIGLATAPVTHRPIVRTLDVPGRIELAPDRVASLRPLEQARVRRLLVAPGDRVQAGEALLLLASPQIAADEAALPGAEAASREAEIGVAVARDALHRSVVLAADGALSRAEAETRRLLLAQAMAKATEARATLIRLRADLVRYGATGDSGEAALRSPIAGVVADIAATEGGVLDPGGSAPAVEVANLHRVIANAAVDATAAFGIAPGDQAEVTLAGAGASPRRWSGQVTAVAAAVDTRTDLLPVRIALANPDETLKAGMFVAVDLSVPTGGIGLTVPPDAVQIVGDRRVVFTPDGPDRFRVRDVSPGVRGSGWTEITKGLAPDDRVVTRGGFELKAILQQSLLGGGG